MRALIVVDLQNDFMPGGPLGVSGAHAVIPLTNALMSRFDVVVATQDWHPPDHGSFAANHDGHSPYDEIVLNGLQQTLWPVHCVQGTSGAAFVDALDDSQFSAVVRKGTDKRVDSYSGFADNGNRNRTGMAGLLSERGVTEVYVCGVATDFCVKFTARDAVAAGFKVFLIEDACRGVAMTPTAVSAALRELEDLGVVITTSEKV
ncbi:MAG: bifunctional nicotinamidase/pyrazinamidase [Myxococcota bacterium]|nr:bifunctional nicotinamidase/pyrazinamidase [Myxococcota bacterium]